MPRVIESAQEFRPLAVAAAADDIPTEIRRVRADGQLAGAIPHRRIAAPEIVDGSLSMILRLARVPAGLEGAEALVIAIGGSSGRPRFAHGMARLVKGAIRIDDLKLKPRFRGPLRSVLVCVRPSGASPRGF